MSDRGNGSDRGSGDRTTVGASDAQLAEKYRPVFERIAAGALDREESGGLALEEARWLRDVGFPAVRVPRELGGDGASLRQLFGLLIELAAAESNLPHALRVHFRFLEDRWRERDTSRGREWLRRIGDGTVLGTAVSERQGPFGEPATTLSDHDGVLRVNGTKYYSTGALYADYLTVLVARDDGSRATALVRADSPGVERIDDWAGFGQRASASGTTIFTDVLVEDESLLFPPPGGVPGHVAFLQLVHLATIAGIVRRATDDAAEFVRQRHRTYRHGSAEVAREDPLVQQVVGRADAAAHAARASTLAVADALDAAADARYALRVAADDPDSPRSEQARREAEQLELAAELDAYRAQSTVLEIALQATNEIFEVGGSSALDRRHHLDRHWRNVRTLASHNPLIYRQRQLGDYVLNGAAPVFNSPEGSSRIGAS